MRLISELYRPIESSYHNGSWNVKSRKVFIINISDIENIACKILAVDNIIIFEAAVIQRLRCVQVWLYYTKGSIHFHLYLSIMPLRRSKQCCAIRWASYQILINAGRAYAGNAENVFPPLSWNDTASQRSRHASRHVRERYLSRSPWPQYWLGMADNRNRICLLRR